MQGEPPNTTRSGELRKKLANGGLPPPSKKPRVFGVMQGQIKMAPDFDETPADIIDAMEGRDGDEVGRE